MSLPDPKTIIQMLRVLKDSSEVATDEAKLYVGYGADALEQMQATVQKLPVTRDGVHVVPLVDPLFDSQGDEIGWWWVNGDSLKHVSKNYSSAQAARNAGFGKDPL